ncbi:MAG: helix-turn-helix domain-containing protein [Nitrososphaerota archaeon]|jgi:transposase|nr:helix-turn-helix domain-containing protein [Nitrososphaerota archaeon]
MKTKYIITLTENEREFVQKIVNDKTTSPTFKKRAQILIALDTNTGKPQTQKTIAQKIGITQPTIYNTLKQYHHQGLQPTLQFKTPLQPNKKQIATGELETRIITTACGKPPKGYARWTVRSLTNKIVLDIEPNISRETICRTLKKLNYILT